MASDRLALLGLLLGIAALPAVGWATTCEELKRDSAARHEARRIWRSEPGIPFKELAARVGASKQATRSWTRRWRAARRGGEEGDCKLYPSENPARGIDSAEAHARFEQHLRPREREACGTRVEACRFLIVDCELPPTLRRLGRRMPSISPRRWVRTTAGECKRKRGEFFLDAPGGEVRIDATANAQPASPVRIMVLDEDGSVRPLRDPEPIPVDQRPLAARRAGLAADDPNLGPGEAGSRWERDADRGSACAQNYLGEMHRRNGRYPEARARFQQAARQGYEKALINLGQLYEEGLGVEADPLAALACYEAATGEEMLLDRSADGMPPEILTRAIESGKLKGPSIEVVDPWLPYREARVAVSPNDRARRLYGRVFRTAEIDLFDLSTGEEVRLEEDGTYEVELPLAADRSEFDFKLTVEDRAGKVDEVEFTLVRSSRALPRREPEQERRGTYHALLIGIDVYEDERFGSLATPVSDVESLRGQLDAIWGFDSISLLGREATLEAILRRLDGYRRTLGTDDNLLVYFAGHGQFVEDRFGQRQGYWIPYDAEESLRSWISSGQIAAQVEAIRAGNVLVIADACFSGFLTRSSIPTDGAGAGSRSVSILTSADDTVALDLGARGNSPFARAVLDVLENWKDSLPASKLARRVQAQFSNYHAECKAGASGQPTGFCEALREHGQEPVFRPIAGGGHQGGEFTFVPARPK